MGHRDKMVAVLLLGLLLACDGDDDDSASTAASTAAVTAGPTAAVTAGPTVSTAPVGATATNAELVIELSDSGDEVTVRYAGRLAQERWPFAEVYRNVEGSPSVQVGWLVQAGETGTYQPFDGRPFIRREEMTLGGPGPETYPVDLPPGDYQVCTQVVPPNELNEFVCTSFTIPG